MGREMISVVLFLMLGVPAHLQEACKENSCHPSLGDLMVGRADQLSASSTCGANGPQNYCILGYLEDEQKCFTCDSRSPYNRYNRFSHQIENVITTFEPERKMKWWQSENGVHQVSIQLDLETVFQFSHLVLTFKSFRPAAMLVERSKDFGRTWKVFRYFSIDCANDFPRISEGPPEIIDDLICDTRYSGAEPSTDGEVVLKALDPNFYIEDPYDPTIQELITITNVRVNFTRLLTLGDDLLGRKRRNPQEKYYYALYEMVVRGSCFCNGHASQCMPVQDTHGDTFSQPGMVHGRCLCEHNTMGNNCEKCKPFYNDAPWRPAGGFDTLVCKSCNCNGHSEQCHFDLQRYLASGQVSGGVCDNCRNHRMGPHCEQCKPHYYMDSLRSGEDPDACITCTCDSVGSLDGGLCDPVNGQCICKQNVEGKHCDRCKLGFYGLNQDNPSGCQVCMCNFMGTVHSSPCDQNTGQCICDHFAHGPECDQCIPGYWGLGNTVFKCTPCDCDIGGALSTMCSSDSGQCQCRANMVGLSCGEPAPGYFLAPLDYYLYEAENAAFLESKCFSYQVKPTAPPYVPPTENVPPHFNCPPYYQNGYNPFPSDTPEPRYEYPTSPPTMESVTVPSCVHYVRSRGYEVTFSDGKFVVVRPESRRKRRQSQQTIPLHPGSTHQVILQSHTPGKPITWTGPGFVRVQDKAGLRFTISNVPLSLNYHLVIRYEPQSTDDWTAMIRIVPLGSTDDCPYNPYEETLTLPSTGRAAILDSPLCLSSGVQYYVEITFEKRASPDLYCSSHIFIDSMGLIPEIEFLSNFCSDADRAQYQQYDCVELVAQAGERTLPEVCERLVASMSAYIHNGATPCRCNPEGSLSLYCSKFGGQCDCKPNVAGRCCDSCAPFSYGFGPNGCLPCNCDSYGSRDEYCDHKTGQCPCHNQFSGRQCDQCLLGYYGFPNCRRCECNGLSDICDQITGACLNCREHSTGNNCERCVKGYSGDPASMQPCERSECDTGYQGLNCDECAPGYYGNLLLPGTTCKKCFCNNNIAPNDGEVCDASTGECLRCMHNTHGPQCQNCKPGYFGNALLQDCRECSCNHQGTEVSHCSLGSPCLCDQVTGQCPCRLGVVGIQCDRCEDEYWNLAGDLNCQPCNCNPEHSVSNLCNKVTGQCPCETGYGGKTCDKCAANHFGNPEIQCMPCDCNMQGSIYPGCDSDTGGCLCRPGVVGDLCDECAPGYDPVFPACEPCHSCYQLWEKDVSNISHSIKMMLSLVLKFGGNQQLTDLKFKERIQKANEKLMNLVSMLHSYPDEIASIENLLSQTKNLSVTIDANLIIIDPSTLLDTDIDNIYHEFKRLFDELQRKMKETTKVDLKSLNDTLENIRKLHTNFLKDGERVKEAKYKLDASSQTRQDSIRELTKCQKRPLDALEKKIKELSVANLNEEICGAPGNVECMKAKCGGALCGNCGGPSCTGSLPLIQNAIDIANKTEAGIHDLLRNLTDAEIKIKEIRDMNKYVKNKAKDMMNKITNSKDKFEQDKNATKTLIQRVSEYLKEDVMEPEDIDKVASAVLAIKLPSSQEEIKKMIEEIQNVMRNFTEFNEDLKNLEDKANLAKNMKNKAEEILNRTKQIDVSEIKKDLNDTVQLHDTVKQKLKKTEDNRNITTELLVQSESKLINVEDNVNTAQVKNLHKETEALRNKTEINRAQAVEAKTAADAALINATDASKDLQKVEEQLQKLKNHTQNNGDVNERLKNIMTEAKNMAKDVENKIKQIEDLEKRIQDAVKHKTDKMESLKELLAEAENIRNNITERVESYLVCTT